MSVCAVGRMTSVGKISWRTCNVVAGVSLLVLVMLRKQLGVSTPFSSAVSSHLFCLIVVEQMVRSCTPFAMQEVVLYNACDKDSACSGDFSGSERFAFVACGSDKAVNVVQMILLQVCTDDTVKKRYCCDRRQE